MSMALDGSFSPNSKWKYHVFLSFRGEDTRLGFTDHLHAALVRKSIKTFRDDEELARGDVISQKLLDAIEESLTAIVIISQNYADSIWCLDELQKIVESKKRLGLEVFPVFYGVDPSDVRHQKGCFAEAFHKHEEKFVQNKEKVDKWRDALKEVANLAGWDSKNLHETKLIEEIVEQALKKLEPKLAIYNDGLVAMDRKVEQMYSYLNLGLEDVRFIGIWGMGGIGKTTIADVIFRKIRNQFDASCFLANVRMVSEEGDQGMIHLQSKLLSHLNLMGMKIETTAQGKDIIRNFLHNKKTLLILDDVTTKIQLEILAGKNVWFGPGSRIIVTTRDKHVLESHGVLFQMYKMEFLSIEESLDLVCEKAFKGVQPKEDYLELSKKIVKYSGGLPLALEVLGSSLCGRSLQEWEDALIKISKVQPDDILNKLKISYDMLEDEHKTIFLDIACFFKGWYKDKVSQILQNCDLHPVIGLKLLIEKSLITCDESVIGMHDVLEELGKTIVIQKSLNELGRRSRLWSFEDIDEVLRNNKGTEKVRGIVLNSSTMSHDEALWHPQAFSKMCNLKFLIILCDLHLPRGLQCLSRSVKVVIWNRFPLKALPLGVQLDEIVHLQLCESKVKNLWKGNKVFRKLKLIDLCNSKELIKTPDVSGLPNLEELSLDGCRKLVEVHKSVGQHKKLAILRLTGCSSLKVLPRKLEMRSLKMLLLSRCFSIERLPEFGENMECVSVLNLMHCRNLVGLPNGISNLKSLKILNLFGCRKVHGLPDKISENKALEDLDLGYTSIRELNPSLFSLQNLKRLSFRFCRGGLTYNNNWVQNLLLPFVQRFNREERDSTPPKFLRLPPFVSGLSSLTSLDLSYCNLTDGLIPEDLGNLPSLERLNLSGNLVPSEPPRCIANLAKLRHLQVDYVNCRAYRALLPPHVRIYPQNSESIFLNPWKVWRLFEDSEHFESHKCEEQRIAIDECYDSPCFDRQNFFPVDGSISKMDTGASIAADIHDNNHRGIAVFIALEPSSSFGSDANIWEFYWSFEASHPEGGPGHSIHLTSLVRAKCSHVLLTMLTSDDHVDFQLHPRGSSNNVVNFDLFCDHLVPEFYRYTKLRLEVRSLFGEKIRKCKWRVLCKEDIEVLETSYSKAKAKRAS